MEKKNDIGRCCNNEKNRLVLIIVKYFGGIENSENYVYSSKWSPINASLLAIGDGNGYLDLMDLNKDIETPIIHCKLGTDAINKICWTEDGKRITVGDSSGKIQLFALDKEIYLSNSEDSKRFEKLLGKMK